MRIPLLSGIYSGFLAFFMLVPLYRPIFIAHHRIQFVYVSFLFALAVFLSNINVVKYVSAKQTWALLLYVFFAILSSIYNQQNIPFDQLGLAVFLIISFYLGVWLNLKGLVHLFFRLMGFVFIVIASYIIFQLSKSSFSYHTYYYWSGAAYKIDYLTASLYAYVLAAYFFFNGKNIVEKYAFVLFCLSFIAICGARYSILFTVITAGYVIFKGLIKNPVKLAGSIFIIFLLFFVIVIFNSNLLSKGVDLISYSLFRIENLGGVDNSVLGRVELFKKALSIISQNFFLGQGVAGSAEALHSNYPHNLLLESFIDGGFFSFIFLSYFFIYSLYLVFKNKSCVWCVWVVLYLFGAYLKSFSIYESRILFFFLGYAIGYKGSKK